MFASDAISSTAYASEEILIVLVPAAGLSVALNQLIPISIIVMVLLTLVISSYRQTIHAYPSGGGSYVVSRENLGETPSLVAGASLLVDYVLTVAVSVSAGVAAITSAFPSLQPERVAICLGFIAIMTLANLRGMKESGRLFAGPTYIYVGILGILILVGLARVVSGHLDALPPNTAAVEELTGGSSLTGLTLLLFLRAFSSGAVALTGIEAVSNGVPAFRKPESRNASITLVIMGGILASYFFGISVLAHQLRPTPSHEETLLSVMGRAVFGGRPSPTSCSSSPPSPFSCWRPTRRSPTSPGSARSSLPTASCLASSRTGATASCSPTASSLSRPWRPSSSWPSAVTPADSSRSTPSGCSAASPSPRSAWSDITSGSRSPDGSAMPRSTPSAPRPPSSSSSSSWCRSSPSAHGCRRS
ncbi:MAG: APC family permease [Acidimicrobiales bacterium]